MAIVTLSDLYRELLQFDVRTKVDSGRQNEVIIRYSKPRWWQFIKRRIIAAMKDSITKDIPVALSLRWVEDEGL